jgi:hypothetical protein
LQVGGAGDDCVAASLKDSMAGGSGLAEVPCVHDDLDSMVGTGDMPQNRHRSILGCVIDEDMLVSVLREIVKHLPNLVIDFPHVLSLVVARRDDAYELHGLSS